MWSIHVISGMLLLITFFNTLHGTNQVAVSVHNTCVLSGTNVSCWGDGMFDSISCSKLAEYVHGHICE